VRYTFRPRSAFPDPGEYWHRQMLTTNSMVPDHRFTASMPLRSRAIAPSHLFCNVDVARQFAVDYDLNRAPVKFSCIPWSVVRSRRTRRSGKKRKNLDSASGPAIPPQHYVVLSGRKPR
jgi:hypothetical protein